MDNCIEITGVDLKTFVKKVYELSSPQGMGMMHFTPEPMTDEMADKIISRGHDDCGFPTRQSDDRPVNMDYVGGRACKMNVMKKEDKLWISNSWYDHTDAQLKQLLAACGIDVDMKGKEHSIACNCSECVTKRGSQA